MLFINRKTNAGPSLSAPLGGNPVGSYTSTVGPSYIIKLNPRMDGIIWRTFYPGSIQDVDSKNNGDIYLCSSSHTSTAFTYSLAGATNIAPTAITNGYSELVSEFDKDGAPLWSSYVGVYPLVTGYSTDSHIKVDTTANEFYVFGENNSGTTDWTGLNTYGTFFHNTPTNNNPDCYIKKFDSNNNMVVSTFIGGNGYDQFKDAVVLANGDVCFVGTTTSTDTLNMLYNPHDGVSYFSKKHDTNKEKGWIAKFSPTFDFKWGTLYGDSAKTTEFRAATTDNLNSNLLIGGYTEGLPNVSWGGDYNKVADVSGDAAFLCFGASNNVTWATAMGANGVGEDGAYGIQYNYKNKSLNFGGGSQANSGYPWQADGNAYFQSVNFGSGHDECTVGRFDVRYITGINEIKNTKTNTSDILLYPNPANSFTNLYFKKGLKGSVNIKIYNTMGQVLETRDYNNLEDNTLLNFNTSNLTEGLYFITILNADSKQTIKFATFK